MINLKTTLSEHELLQQLNNWVSEAVDGHDAWRKQSWNDAEFLDGVQWDGDMLQKMQRSLISPIVSNKIFPIVKLVYGFYLKNQPDIVAKGRTSADGELSQVMSESIAYVMDSNDGSFLRARAFLDGISSGIGFLEPHYSSDPRKEKVALMRHKWYDVWWDIYSDPWFSTETCRYVFTAPWKDLRDVVALFPEKRAELLDLRDQDSVSFSYLYNDSVSAMDEASLVESRRRDQSSFAWFDETRARVRPVEMWYTRIEQGLFAVMKDGRVIDLDAYDCQETFEIVQQATEVVSAFVKRMRVAVFVQDILLQDSPSPYAHDEFPIVPFVGYLDRFEQPYGIPRQIKGENVELNKRRSMMLALMNSRRVLTEKGAVENENRLYEEANRMKSFIVTKPGALRKVKVEDLSALAPAQQNAAQIAENSMKEIAGANDEALGYSTPASMSGVALEMKQESSATVVAELIENSERSSKILGRQVMSLIQDSWTEGKVLRVTDRVSGVEEWVELNKKVYDPEFGAVQVHNDITQSQFDIVISETKMTDTMREKNVEFLKSAINRAPAEAVAPMTQVMFELSNLPQAERISEELREATGVEPYDMMMTKKERQAKLQEKAAAKKAQQEAEQAYKQQVQDLDLEKRKAEIRKIDAEAAASLSRAQSSEKSSEATRAKSGVELGNEIFAKKTQTGGQENGA